MGGFSEKLTDQTIDRVAGIMLTLGQQANGDLPLVQWKNLVFLSLQAETQ